MEDITNATLFPASEEAFFSCVHSLVQLQRLVVMRYENQVTDRKILQDLVSP